MKNEILVKLRNVLAHLYPDEASMRRISHDAGLDLARVSLTSSAINNWHLILIETEKLDCVDVLLTAVKQEYGSNQEFVNVCKDIRQINFIVPLGHWKEVRNSLFKEQSHTNAAKAIEERFQSFDWSKAEQAYLNKVIKLYDRVRILGSSADVPLGNLFTQVYILNKPTARYRHDIEELRKRGADRNEFQRQPGERIHGLDLVKTGQNLFILGKPGAGKTTFLKYITIQAAIKQLPRIPIFVSLNQWADSRWSKGEKAALLPFLAEQLDICGFPNATLFLDYLLREGRALVLFDALDEVKQEKDQRRRLTHLLQDFAHKYDKSQYLITCRIAASDYAFSGFIDVEMADFTPEQVHEYAHNWFGVEAKKFDAFTTELAKSENQGLAELCKTPLLLALLCLTFDNNLYFPPSRAELYEDALETLLRKWDSSRAIQRDEIYRDLSYKRKLQLLMSIAVPTFKKGELFFLQCDLEHQIVDYLAKLPGTPHADLLDGTPILKTIEAQHSILVERAQGIYSFSHLTFQEYLTARYLAENLGKRVADDLIHRHLTDKRWREVFLLTASLLGNADSFIGTLHHMIDSIIIESVTLHRLLVWTHDRTKRANAPVERQHTVQLAYIFLELVRSLDRALALTLTLDQKIALALDIALTLARSLTPDLVLALERALSLTRDLDLDRTLARTQSLDFERALVLASPRPLDIARSFDLTTTSLVGFDYGLYYSWAYAALFADERLYPKNNRWQRAMKELPTFMQDVIGLADEGTRLSLANQLPTQFIPNSTRQVWQQYADSLFVILRDQRDLGHEWNFSDKDLDKLNDYFYANELLVQCLKVAAVSDREAVLLGLLLPPENLKGEGAA